MVAVFHGLTLGEYNMANDDYGMSNLIGLDLSTSHVGYCSMDRDGSVLELNCIDLKPSLDIWQKLELVTKELTAVCKKHRVNKIYVEESLKMFMGQRSSANVILLLSNFNILVRYSLSQNLDIRPQDIELINVITARKLAGLKIDKSLKNTKQQVLQYVIANIGDSYFDRSKKGKTNELPTYIANSYDKADAYIIAKSGYLQCRDKLLVP